MTEEDLQHPKFQSFLDKLEETIPQMNGYELSSIAVDIMDNELLQKHEINKTVYDALMTKFQELTFKRMLYVDLIIQKNKSKLFYQKLQLKMQEMFLENIESIFNNNNYDSKTFISIANYMNDHSEIVRPDILKQFSTALLHLDEYQLHIASVRQIMMLFSKFVELDEQSKIALKKIVKVWTRSNPTLKDVELLLFLLFKCNGNRTDKQAFENSGFIAFILNLLDKSCGEKVFASYRSLIQMVFIIDPNVIN